MNTKMPIEHKLCFGLIVSDEYLRRVTDIRIWHEELIESPAFKHVGKWALDYYAEFKKAPGKHIEDIFFEHAAELSKTDAAQIELMLEIVSEDYGDDWRVTSADVNPAYLTNLTITYFSNRRLAQQAENIEDLRLRGKRDEAITAMAEAAADAIEMEHTGDLSRARNAAWRIITAGAAEERLPDPWGDPDPPTFDLTMLPPVLRYFASEKARSMGVNEGALVWGELTACSSALNGSLRLQMKRGSRGFTVPPGIWVLVVGDPSSLKTPIFDETFAPLRAIQSDNIKRYESEKRLWDAEDPKERGPEPTFVQLLTHDSTTEGLRDLLANQDRGIVAFNDEWSRHIGAMGRYSGGRDAGAADRAFYNDAYGGGERVFNRAGRKGGERIVVRNLQITVIGGIQPDVLRKLNRNGELTADGMLQRSCTILMGKLQIGADIDTTGIEQRYEHLIRRLEAVPGNRTLTLTEAAAAVRVRVEQRLFPYLQNGALGLGFKTAVGKLHGIWGRLALTLAHVLAPRDTVITEVDERAAVLAERLVFESLIPNMARFYQMLGGGGDLETTRAIADFLLRQQRVRVTARDIVQNVHAIPNRKTDQVREAMSPLVSMGWVTLETDDERRARAWLVNQAIYGQFAEQAVQARANAAMAREAIARSAAARRVERDEPTKRDELTSPDQTGENVADVACAQESNFSRTSPDIESVASVACAQESNFSRTSPDIESASVPRAHKQHSQHARDRSPFRDAVLRTAMRDRVSRAQATSATPETDPEDA